MNSFFDDFNETHPFQEYQCQSFLMNMILNKETHEKYLPRFVIVKGEISWKVRKWIWGKNYILSEMRVSTQLTLPITSDQQQSENRDGSVCLSNTIFIQRSIQGSTSIHL